MICGKGFGMILVLVWATALSSDLTLVSGQTVAPKTSSTVPPQLDEKPMIVNAPPTKQKKMPEMKPETDMKMKMAKPKEAAVASPSAAGSKPLQVTGFITKTGSIYEIEDRRGSIGAIEGRQAVEEKRQADQIVCNYGNVVIYSDVPCDEVTNVRVGEIKQIKGEPAPAEDTAEQGEQDEQQQQASEQESQMTPQQDSQQEEDSQPQQQQQNNPRQQQNNRRRRRRPQQVQQQQRRRRRQQQQLQQRRRNGNGNGNVRRRRNRNGNNNLRRGQQQQRRRRVIVNDNNNNIVNNNNNNRRGVNGNRRNNNNQRRRQQQQRRRRLNNNNRNRNRNRQGQGNL